MPTPKQLIECVPNFSEGRDNNKIEKIVEPFRKTEGVKLLDYQNDKDHNRTVVTVIGDPKPLKSALLEAAGIAIEQIDMTTHKGEHPRMGAVDVVPFIPIQNLSMENTIEISKTFAASLSYKYNLPVFLYEKSAQFTERENLSTIRKGQFEKMSEKMRQPEWAPDYGPTQIHPTAGVTAVGARMPLVAYNINLNTDKIAIADDISKKIRHIGGGLRYVKAIGVELKDQGIVQVSMNLTDYSKTAVYQAFEMVKMEAKRYGVTISGSEIVGLVPMAALMDTASYYLGLENFSQKQVIESRLME